MTVPPLDEQTHSVASRHPLPVLGLTCTPGLHIVTAPGGMPGLSPGTMSETLATAGRDGEERLSRHAVLGERARDPPHDVEHVRNLHQLAVEWRRSLLRTRKETLVPPRRATLVFVAIELEIAVAALLPPWSRAM